MKKINIKTKLSVIVIVMLSFFMAACGKKVVIDYGDAASFEAALNAGDNLEGKTVQFEALELHPDSASGYNVWAGEHLNFISARNPDIKAGDIVTVRATEIESALGSWLIKYEKIDNAVAGDDTITSTSAVNGKKEEFSQGETQNSSVDNGSNTAYKADTIAVENSVTEEEKSEVSIEAVDAGIVAFKDYFGKPKVGAFVAFKNVSNVPIILRDARIEYQDDAGKLLTVDDMVNCIPEAIKPGQIGYMYSYYHSLEGVDLSNGLQFNPDAQIYEADNFYEIEVSDVSFKEDTYMDIEVTARGANNSGRERSFAKPGAIFFDKNGSVMGFCYGLEEFADGQTKAFNISGDLLSEDYDASDVDHVEVYIQGNDW